MNGIKSLKSRIKIKNEHKEHTIRKGGLTKDVSKDVIKRKH